MESQCHTEVPRVWMSKFWVNFKGLLSDEPITNLGVVSEVGCLGREKLKEGWTDNSHVQGLSSGGRTTWTFHTVG